MEAFRDALKRSARKPANFPRDAGAGILDVDTLINTPPTPAKDLKNAYNGWNENAFFASIQGYGELLKTYWNSLHGWLTGKKKSGEEAISTEAISLSSTSQKLEETLFAIPGSRYEASSSYTADDLLNRYQAIQSIVEQATK